MVSFLAFNVVTPVSGSSQTARSGPGSDCRLSWRPTTKLIYISSKTTRSLTIAWPTVSYTSRVPFAAALDVAADVLRRLKLKHAPLFRQVANEAPRLSDRNAEIVLDSTGPALRLVKDVDKDDEILTYYGFCFPRKGYWVEHGAVTECSAATCRLPTSDVERSDTITCCDTDCNATFHHVCYSQGADYEELNVWERCKENADAWLCFDCSTCTVCGKGEGDDSLLFCDNCDRAVHHECDDMSPTDSDAPYPACPKCRAASVSPPSGSNTPRRALTLKKRRLEALQMTVSVDESQAQSQDNQESQSEILRFTNLDSPSSPVPFEDRKSPPRKSIETSYPEYDSDDGDSHDKNRTRPFASRLERAAIFAQRMVPSQCYESQRHADHATFGRAGSALCIAGYEAHSRSTTSSNVFSTLAC